MPTGQEDGETPGVEPLTRRNADGEIYRRDLVVEQQIADALRLSCQELVIRASISDKNAAGYLKEETLVHLIRRGRRQHQPDLVSELSLILLRRCTPLVNRRLSSLSKDALADAYAEVVASLFEQILNLKSDRGDFVQVRFWVIVERLVVRAFDKQVWEANRARQVIYLSKAGDDDCDGEQNGQPSLELRTNGEGDQHLLEATFIEQESLREALSLIDDSRHRSALLLRYVAGWPIETNDPSERSISRHFDVSPRTIRTWLRLAKEALGQWKKHSLSQRHLDQAEAVLDAFIASAVNPDAADLESWVRRFPEYERELRRFAASWGLVDEMATEPDPNGPADDVLIGRGAEIVGELLGQLGSVNHTVARAIAPVGEAPIDVQEETIQRYERLASGATRDAQRPSTMLGTTVENEFEQQTPPTRTAVSGGGPGRLPVRTGVGTVPQPGLPERLKILLVDQNPEAIAGLRRTLNDFDRLEVVGDAGFGPVASTWAHTLEPAVILVAVEEPVARALATVQSLSRGSPPWTVVALVGQFNRDVFRRAVLAGARDVMTRSAAPIELRDAIIEVRRADSYRKIEPTQDSSAPTGTIITVFGVKGGIGKTTIATNLAVALPSETSASVALVDLDLPFGDIALMLDLHPDRDVMGALEDPAINDLERLQASLVRAPQGIHVLAAPSTPGIAAHVDPDRVGRLLLELAELYQFVIVDTPVGLTELTAVALDVAELGLFVTTPEVPSLRRTQACMRLLQQLDFPIQKVQIVLNRVKSRTGVSEAEAAQTVPITWRVANDSTAVTAAAFGQPVVLAQPKTQLARDICGITRRLAGLTPETHRFGWLPWRGARRARFKMSGHATDKRAAVRSTQ